MRYGTKKEKNTKLREGLIKMTGKGEPWHMKEEEPVVILLLILNTA